MRISIVVPVYFNELNLPDTIPNLLALEPKLGMDLELVFVDDGSGDRSFAILREFQQKYRHKITVVKLTRNFGSHAAVMAGIATASGDCVGSIGADLQDGPEIFIEMAKHWRAGTKVLLATRSDRHDPASTTLFAKFYYELFCRFGLKTYPKNGFDSFLLDKEVCKELIQMRPRHTNVAAIIIWLGYAFKVIPTARSERTKGTSRWTFAKKLRLFSDSFIDFSVYPALLPLYSLVIVGVVDVLALLMSQVGIADKLAVELDQFAYRLAILLIFLSLAIVGEYARKSLELLRNRPWYVVDQKYPADLLNSVRDEVHS